MSSDDDLADAHWLTGPDAEPWLALAADDGVPLHRQAAQLRQALSPARAHLVLEQAELRRRGRTKFALGDRLFFTRRGLQQATDQWIAAYKANRFPAGELAADLCCGIGGDSLGLAARGPVEAFDRDPIVAIFADANVRLATPPSSAAPRAICGDAQRLNLSGYCAWHIDPDRRGSGRRTVDPLHMSPSLAAVEQWRAQNEHAAIKLAPATSPPQAWRDRAELEWISRDRECRQLVAWFGRLARWPGLRRATVLDANGAVAAHVEGEPLPLPPAASALMNYVFEPDPAVLAAGLAGQLAQAHLLRPLAPQIPYLTADEPIEDRALAAFRVVCALPFDEKRLATELRAIGIGRLEIKCRGVRIVPEEVRKRLRLQGDRNGVLLVTPQNGQTIAILAERDGTA
jgi:hypothetical protein